MVDLEWTEPASHARDEEEDYATGPDFDMESITDILDITGRD